MKFLIIFILFFALKLYPVQKIEIVADWNVDCNWLTEMVKKEGLVVVLGDPNRFVKPPKASKMDKIISKASNKIPIEKDLSRIMFWNLSNKQKRKSFLKRLSDAKLVLFMWEPPSVLTFPAYLPKYFNRIYTWNDDLVDNKNYFKFYYPVLQEMVENRPSFEEKKLCTMVIGKHSSNYIHELYTAREEAIAFFEKKPLGEFEFYGRGWDPIFKNYKGTVEDKIGTIKNYKFSICFENTKEIRGYVTEKIFDCFAAGNIPVYWGASNVTSYIPADCFIDMRTFSSFDQLYQFLKEMPKETYEGYISRIKKFLCSEPAQLFSSKHFQEIFYEAATF